MAKPVKYCMLLVISLFILTISVGCINKSNINTTFSIEQFQSEMKARGYKFKMKDVQKDFLPTTRKRMEIVKEAIDIYLFSSTKEMEDEAKHIDSEGSVYSNGNMSFVVDWIAPPHFYKKGNIIVQYVGVSKKIISDLKGILGEQFVGAK